MCSISYKNSLCTENRLHYEKKLREFNVNDPYTEPLSSFDNTFNLWPKIDHGDIVNYLVFSTNSLTNDQMKCYKSLESHNYFTSGWVNKAILAMTKDRERVLLVGEVNHSQSLSSPTLKVWILAKLSGEVLTAHCTCVAGMGAACSHVGAMLFAIQTGVRMRDEASCTEKENAWLPSYAKQAPYDLIQNLDYNSAAMRKRKLDIQCSKLEPIQLSSNQIPSPSAEEVKAFFQNVSQVSPYSGILSLLPEHSDKFVQKSPVDGKLTKLYDCTLSSLSWEELLQHCKELYNSDCLKLTASQVKHIEAITKGQTKCKLWYEYRTGRITASLMKAVCQTKLDKPSRSLLSKICKPLEKNFRTAATVWGCSHEKIALEIYAKKQELLHSGLQTTKSGLHISCEFPHIGATPDALLSCECCGTGVCEIKCPYCAKNNTPDEIAHLKTSCLEIDEAGNIQLNREHSFYYQIQCQLSVCNVDYCDFVLWTEKSIHIERIYPDVLFWETALEKATQFFLNCVLPELTISWFSKVK